MIKKWRSGWLFPLVLAIGLGGLSAWLGRISELDIEEVALNPNEPQYAMIDIDGRRFDETGRLKMVVKCSRRGWGVRILGGRFARRRLWVILKRLFSDGLMPIEKSKLARRRAYAVRLF